jgi:hypothetical protein
LTKAIKIEGVKWIVQPPNYEFADFIGAISDNRMAGAVISPDGNHVGEFQLAKK